MKLWLLRPAEQWVAADDQIAEIEGNPWWPWYDKHFGFVVRAETEQAARQLASDDTYDDEQLVWLNPELTTCVELTTNGEPKVIIEDFHSA